MLKKTPDFELPEFVLRFDQDVGKKPNFLLIIIFYCLTALNIALLLLLPNLYHEEFIALRGEGKYFQTYTNLNLLPTSVEVWIFLR